MARWLGKNLETKQKITPMGFVVFVCVFSMFITACSQSVDEVNIHGPPPGRSVLLNSDLSGAATSPPSSVSRSMGDHSVGGMGLRTQSTSASRRMVSGIGVE
jgi:hypothetical protein